LVVAFPNAVFGTTFVAELIAGMFTASRYKRSQGRIARQATLFAVVAVFAVMAWRSVDWLGEWVVGWLPQGLQGNIFLSTAAKYSLPLLILALGAWIAYRIVNIPSFADFLISVEAEMNKVSWPSRGELYRASLVVIVVIFVLTAILFAYDLVLKAIVNYLLGGVGGEQ
jgi:preprotein translocase subunit SecE